MEDLTKAYVAKQIARYLQIEQPTTGFERPLLYRTLFKIDEQKERHARWEASQDSDAGYSSMLEASGLTTVEEKDAYLIVDMAGLAVRGMMYHNRSEIEHISFRDHLVEEAITTYEFFEDWLRSGVNTGIRCVEENYWISRRGVKKPQIVNPDFSEKAVNWLIDEVTHRTTNMPELVFLETIKLKDDEGSLRLSRI